MDRERVWHEVTQSLRQGFGRLLDVRDVRRVRRVAGDAWLVTVVLSAPSGEIHVADVTVDDAGAMTSPLGADDVVEAVKRSIHSARPSYATPGDELADFGSDLSEETSPADDELDFEMLSEGENPVGARVAAALARGDRASLETARELLPRLLTDHERRGTTLLTMADVEFKLGDATLARGYLEASAREFADRFDLDSLEKAATLALERLARDEFTGSPVHSLLEQSRARLHPLANLFDARSFGGLPTELRERLMPHVVLRTLAPGESLVSEGDPSRFVFVVKSGLIGVWLERPTGGSWLVRCCFPGWLLGENSVLGGADARCTASLRAQRVTEVWSCPASAIRELMDEDLDFSRRIAETKQLHRIDSFFSMHETMGQLDVHVRDEMLSCIQRLESFPQDALIVPANVVPTVACLVARGSIVLTTSDHDNTPVSVVNADSFYGVRDAIHRIAPSLSATARAGSTIAFFDAARLQKLSERSPAHVIAVLERLG